MQEEFNKARQAVNRITELNWREVNGKLVNREVLRLFWAVPFHNNAVDFFKAHESENYASANRRARELSILIGDELREEKEFYKPRDEKQDEWQQIGFDKQEKQEPMAVTKEQRTEMLNALNQAKAAFDAYAKASPS